MTVAWATVAGLHPSSHIHTIARIIADTNLTTRYHVVDASVNIFPLYVQDECIVLISFVHFIKLFIWLALQCGFIWKACVCVWRACAYKVQWYNYIYTEAVQAVIQRPLLSVCYCSLRTQFALQKGPPSMVSKHCKGMVCGPSSSVLSRQWRRQRRRGTLLRWFLLIN